MSAQLQTAVIGPTGYTGYELLQILFRHSRVKTPLLFVREGAEKTGTIGDVYPQLNGKGSLPLEPFSWSKAHQAGVDLLFLATPHEFSRDFVPEAISRGFRVVDLSGAWRLQCPQNVAVYGFKDADADAAKKLTESAAYGLPELHKDAIAHAQLVANPGCYPTTIILALAPFVAAGLVDVEAGVIADSKSGVSGAGKAPKADTHFVEVSDNFRAYNPTSHRHRGEILEQLKIESDDLVFTPHLLPITRGMFSTIYVQLREAANVEKIEQVWKEFYKDAPFVRVFGTKIPEIAWSVKTNYCDLGFALAQDGRRLTLFSAIDNLVKGASGQAVQNMNVMYGFDEREGLQ
ncbi:MAG TPA: N-acetyl-gamma-glutamyl-phosphate reductase [Terriglobales bacterium]|nr:N-acetyl-gamma-glutamyl-phosphate reductase [Terriglobales bacterium]